MEKKKINILILIFVLAIVASACYIPEIISSDDVIATEVSDALEDALKETKYAATQNPLSHLHADANLHLAAILRFLQSTVWRSIHGR